MRISFLASGLLALILTSPGVAQADRTVSATVLDVVDGDTLRVDAPHCHRCRVRMTEIDAPEHDQPYGQAARRTLITLTGGVGSTVTLVIQGKDQYGRLLARVYKGDVNVNWAMVRAGAVWVYDRYSNSPKLQRLQATARRAGRGLWALADDQRMPPWQWRHGGNSKARSVFDNFTSDMRQAAEDLTGFISEALK